MTTFHGDWKSTQYRRKNLNNRRKNLNRLFLKILSYCHDYLFLLNSLNLEIRKIHPPLSSKNKNKNKNFIYISKEPGLIIPHEMIANLINSLRGRMKRFFNLWQVDLILIYTTFLITRCCLKITGIQFSCHSLDIYI